MEDHKLEYLIIIIAVLVIAGVVSWSEFNTKNRDDLCKEQGHNVSTNYSYVRTAEPIQKVFLECDNLFKYEISYIDNDSTTIQLK